MEDKTKTYGEVLATVHGQIKSITTSIHTLDLENKICVSTCLITTHRGESFTGIGDAAAEDLSPEFADAFVRISETRAKARAVKDLANIGEPLAEELTPAHEVFTPTHKKIVANNKREQASSKNASQEAASLIQKAVDQKEEKTDTKREVIQEAPPMNEVTKSLLELSMEARDEQVPILAEKYGYNEEELRASLVVEKTGLYTLEGLKDKKLPEMKQICFSEFNMEFLKTIFKRMKTGALAEAIIAIQEDELKEYLVLRDVDNEVIDDILATYVPPAFVAEEREKMAKDEVLVNVAVAESVEEVKEILEEEPTIETTISEDGKILGIKENIPDAYYGPTDTEEQVASEEPTHEVAKTEEGDIQIVPKDDSELATNDSVVEFLDGIPSDPKEGGKRDFATVRAYYKKFSAAKVTDDKEAIFNDFKASYDSVAPSLESFLYKSSAEELVELTKFVLSL